MNIMKHSFTKKAALICLFILLIAIIGGLIFMKCAPQFGALPQGKRLERIERSDNYRDGRFQNPVETRMGTSFSSTVKSTIDFFAGGDNRVPDSPVPYVELDSAAFDQNERDGLHITWLGHSTVVIEIDGFVILTDPMFGKRASPLSFTGPKRFNDKLPMATRDFNRIDAIIISHDHYDHLDYTTILELEDKTNRFYVPLGVGAHLEKWGVSPGKIVELDWWEDCNHDGLQFIAAPARHFSGRGFKDHNKTLWSSWIIKSEDYSIFFGGDSGYFEGFKQIGDKYGPFDVTMLESGAYSEYWPYIHMMPEDTVRAHLDLGGRILLPIHWGKFNLSLHNWTEPIVRLLKAAQELNVIVATPMIGETMDNEKEIPDSRWWEIRIEYTETTP